MSGEKNQLERAWTLWYDDQNQKNNKGGEWGNSLKPVYTFRTVEDFWWYGLCSEKQLTDGSGPKREG